MTEANFNSDFQSFLRSQNRGANLRAVADSEKGKKLIRLSGKLESNDASRYSAISVGGILSSLTQPKKLTVKCESDQDSINGNGAKSIVIEGLNSSGSLIREEVLTNGAAISAETKSEFIFVNKAFVNNVGLEDSSAIATNTGKIEVLADDNPVCIIDNDGFGRGESQSCDFKVPSGKKAFVVSVSLYCSEVSDILIMKQKEGQAARVVLEFKDLKGSKDIAYEAPTIGLPELSNLIFLTKGSGSVSASAQILLVDM